MVHRCLRRGARRALGGRRGRLEDVGAPRSAARRASREARHGRRTPEFRGRYVSARPDHRHRPQTAPARATGIASLDRGGKLRGAERYLGTAAAAATLQGGHARGAEDFDPAAISARPGISARRCRREHGRSRGDRRGDRAQRPTGPHTQARGQGSEAIRHLRSASRIRCFNRAMPFRAALTNPVPKGLINTTGTFGPWRAAEPGDTPVKGAYTFKNVDLNTIKGLAGTLSSDGEFSGKLAEIDVNGKTSTPDFSIDVGGRPVPLVTQFHAVVDGTDGDTYLRRVDAKFLDTALTATGAITGRPGIKGRTIQLDVQIDGGKIDDVLRLAVKSANPVMSGALALQTSLLIPPGPARIADRMELEGHFAIAECRFTDPAVHSRLVTLSRHSQGKDTDDPAGRVLSNMRGQFSVNAGTVRFKTLTFEVPGAAVHLAGDYGLRSEQLNFAGTFSMQATISEAVGGGVKGALLKAVDPIFKKGGHGAVVPIRIHGTREKPEFGLDVKKSLGIGS